MVTTANPWSVVTATARGSAHGLGVPNQDRIGTRWIRASYGPVLLVALSDGHGGDRHVRSHHGAEVAVQEALDVLTEQFTEHHRGRSDFGKVLSGSLSSIVERWTLAISEHLSNTPFTQQELEQGASALSAYGATLIVAAVGPESIALAQIGDGDTVVRTASGEVTVPIPGDERLVGGATTSLCLPDAVKDFRTAQLLSSSECTLVLLATDGYGNSFASPEWRTLVVSDLARALEGVGPDVVHEALPDWLAESAAVGGDDVTVALIYKSAGAEPGPERRHWLRRPRSSMPTSHDRRTTDEGEPR